MPAIYRHTMTIPQAAIDDNGHVNNVTYVQWMQDVATMHSDARGCPRKKYLQLNSCWVVRTHHIDYLRPAFAGDRIEIQTWVSTMQRSRSLRRYRFLNARGELLAKAETDWVYVNNTTGRPKKIDAEVMRSFILVPPGQEP